MKIQHSKLPYLTNNSCHVITGPLQYVQVTMLMSGQHNSDDMSLQFYILVVLATVY